MNADDEKKLQRIANLLLGRLDIANEPDEQEFDRGIVLDELHESYALGRRAGMTEAAGICHNSIQAQGPYFATMIKAAIEKARDA